METIRWLSAALFELSSEGHARIARRVRLLEFFRGPGPPSRSPVSDASPRLGVNESGGPYEKTRVVVNVGVACGSNIQQVREVLFDAACSVAHVVDDPVPRIRFSEMGDSALIFRVQAWIDEPNTRGLAIDGMNTAIYNALGEANIEIPFPQRVVHLPTNQQS